MLDTAPEVPAGDGPGAFLITAFAVLALVGVLLWAALRARTGRAAGGPGAGPGGWRGRLAGAGRMFGPIRVVGRAPLDPGQVLYVVEVAGTAILLATDEGGVHTLARLDGEAVERAVEELAPGDERPGFARLLWAALARSAGERAPRSGPEPGDGGPEPGDPGHGGPEPGHG